MLQLNDVEDLLDERAYRPGWVFRVYEGHTTRQLMMAFQATMPDSYNPGKNVPLDIRSPVPRFALEDVLSFDKWFAWRLQQIEIHESQEWYRKPGQEHEWVPVFNPHRDGADRDEWPIVKRDA